MQGKISELSFIASPIALATGIVAYFALPTEPALMPVALGLCAVLLLWSGLGMMRTVYWHGWIWIRHSLVGLALVLSGFLLAGWEAHRLYAPQLTKRLGTQDFTARVVWAEPRPTGSLLLLAPHDLGEEGRRLARIRLYGKRADVVGLYAGCSVRLTALIIPLSKRATMTGYDMRFHAYYDRIGATGFVRDIGPIDCTGPLTWRERLTRLRQRVGIRIAEVLPMPQSAIAIALLTGARGRIDAASKDAFRDSGLAHMLAISGLHMMLMAGGVYVVLRFGLALMPRLAQRMDIRKICAPVALIVALAYLLFSGMGVATQRAFIMSVLVFLAILMHRWALTMRNVAWAALLVMLLAPHTVMLASFQMSFAAVIALVAFYEHYGRSWLAAPYERTAGWLYKFRRIAMLYVGGLVLTSLIAGAVTGVIAAWHFQRVAALGLIANILAMPLLGVLVMPAGMVSLLMMPLGLETPALHVMGLSIAQIFTIAQWVTQLPGAALSIGASHSYVLALAWVGFLWLCLWPNRWRLIGALILGLAVLSLGQLRGPDLYVLGSAWQIAIRQADGRLGITKASGRQFEARQWLNYTGDTRHPYQAGLDCKSFLNGLCLLPNLKNAQLIWAKTHADLLQACEARVDLILTPLRRPPRCKARYVLGRPLLRPYEVRAVFFRDMGDQKLFFTHQATARIGRLWTGDAHGAIP